MNLPDSGDLKIICRWQHAQ
uniref:Uncharacterized protein n=1 Tax=Rhizophora mucronata TaxID=61149 RepID=A0A2P2P3J3_RHIMU